MTDRIAEYSRPGHFLVHLSDTHFLANGRLYDSVDSESELGRLLTGLVASGARPDAIVVTGDLADKGEARAYAALRDMLAPIAEQLGARLIWVMGNHDERSAFRTELLDGGVGDEPIDRVDMVNGLRIVTLDTSVPGHHFGALERSQLDWLADVLSEPAPNGTILAMHHPPIPCVLDLAVTVELRDQRELAEVLTGTDVRSIIAGHLHYSTMATFAGIPVSVASATCYTQDLAAPTGSTRPRNGAQSYNLVHVYDHTVMHSVVTAGDFPMLGFVSATETEAILAGEGIALPPARVPQELRALARV